MIKLTATNVTEEKKKKELKKDPTKIDKKSHNKFYVEKIN